MLGDFFPKFFENKNTVDNDENLFGLEYEMWELLAKK
jgi:hypothetical protein